MSDFGGVGRQAGTQVSSWASRFKHSLTNHVGCHLECPSYLGGLIHPTQTPKLNFHLPSRRLIMFWRRATKTQSNSTLTDTSISYWHDTGYHRKSPSRRSWSQSQDLLPWELSKASRSRWISNSRGIFITTSISTTYWFMKQVLIWRISLLGAEIKAWSYPQIGRRSTEEGGPKGSEVSSWSPRTSPLTDLPRRPASENSNKSNVEIGAMLPPPLKAPRGLQKKTKQQTPKSAHNEHDLRHSLTYHAGLHMRSPIDRSKR